MRQLRSSTKQAVVLSSDDEAATTNAKATRANSASTPGPTSQSSQARAKPKPKEKTLYSFFNAATQRQQSRKSVSPRKPASGDVVDVDDIIQDDSPDDEPTPDPDKTGDAQSSLGLALRKRQRSAFSEADPVDAEALSAGSQKFLKTSTGQRRSTPMHATTPVREVDQRPWVDKYGPISLEELAVHKRKVAHVRAWLANVFEGRERKRLLVLKGAAGTAKTTTVSLLAKEMGFEINEWKNPVGSDFSSDTFVSLSAQFEDFMGRSGKFGSLDFGETQAKNGDGCSDGATGNQVVLIEEFPNTFTRSSLALQSFRSAIEQYLSSSVPSLGAMFTRLAESAHPPTPIVMIISETLLSTNTAAADSFTAHRLLGPDIMNHPGTTVIEFNSIAPTILTKAVGLVVAKEARKSGRKTTPGPKVIKKLSEIGDVRSAVSTLEFLCLRGDETADWGSRVTFKGSKKGTRDKPLTTMEQESLAMVTQRESTLGIFHAVGKVVYNKREESLRDPSLPQPPNHLPQHRRPKASEVDIDSLLDELGTDIQTFVAALHENYVLSCSAPSDEDTLDSINGCIDALSDADLLSPDRFSSVGLTRRTYQGSGTDSLRQDEMSFQTSVRGLLFGLPHPVKRSAPPAATGEAKGPGTHRNDSHKMFYPTSAKIWRLQEEIEGLLDVATKTAQMSGLDPHEASAKFQKPGGVESWTNRPNAFGDSRSCSTATSADDGGSDMIAALGSSGSLKREMLLERLPYMAMMLRRKKGSASGATLRDVERITGFSGVGVSTDDYDALADDDDAEAAAELQHEERSTDRPTDQVPPPRSCSGAVTSLGANARDQAGGGIMIGGVGERGLADLVLSDDDIEDD